jgi:branched-chain amino acid transport system substrate-binding protein
MRAAHATTALGLLLLTVACGSRGAAPSAGPRTTETDAPPVRPTQIVVGAVLPLSGDDASRGLQAMRGIELAHARVAAAGGIDGVPVVIYFYDSESTEIGAIRAGLRAVDDDAALIIGELDSKRTLAVADAALATRTPVLSPIAGDRPVSDRPHVHTLARSYPLVVRIAGKYLRSQGRTTVAGLATARSMLSSLRGRSRSPFPSLVAHDGCRREHYPTVLQSFASANAGAIIAVRCAPDQAAKINAARSGLSTRLPLIADPAWDTPAVISDPINDGTLLVTYFHPDDPVAQDFVAAYRGAHDEEPSGIAALGHDATTVAFEALSRSSLEPQDLDDMIAKHTSTDLATGSPKSMAIVQIAGGTTVFVDRVAIR